MSVVPKPTTRHVFSLLLLLGLASVLAPAPQAVWQQDILRTALLLARVGTLLLLPGLALIALLKPFKDMDILQTISLAVVTSLALFPLCLYWMGTLGGLWNALLVRVLLILCTLVVIWRVYKGRQLWLSSGKRPIWPVIALAAIAGLGLAVRLYQIKGIPYPAWVDSYHHTIITQIMLDTGRVPQNYFPYAGLGSFLYHFGFHAISAFVAWATGLPAHRAVFWGGQVLNALTPLSLFFFVDRVGRDRRAALITAAVSGLVCRMPAYYVNWGRYSQLAGQVILPVALAALVEVCDSRDARRSRWRATIFGGILAAGLLFTHYRVAILYFVGAFVFALAVLVKERCHLRRFWLACGRLLLLGGVVLLLTLPWLTSLVNKTVAVASQALATNPGSQYDYITLDFVLGYGLRGGVLLAAMAAAIWLLLRVRRRQLGLIVLLWLGTIFFLANPVISGTPSGFLSNGSIIVALYLPASVLIGLAVGDVWTRLGAWFGRHAKATGRWAGPRIASVALVIGLLFLSAWGAQDMLRHGLESWRYLVSNRDLEMMDWIRKETPPEARFAVGAEFWLPVAATGNDAGYWLPYIAGRRTNVPPMIYINEAGPRQIEAINARIRKVTEASSAEALAGALRENGTGYVYLGDRIEQPWGRFLLDERYFECVHSVGAIRVYRPR